MRGWLRAPAVRQAISQAKRACPPSFGPLSSEKTPQKQGLREQIIVVLRGAGFFANMQPKRYAHVKAALRGEMIKSSTDGVQSY
jgi:hypothetical protein